MSWKNYVSTVTVSTPPAKAWAKVRKISVRLLLDTLVSSNKIVEFCWIPGHIGIIGNELVDQAVKSAALQPVVDDQIAFSEDIMAHLHKLVLEEWQSLWSFMIKNKLRAIKENVRLWASSDKGCVL